MNKKGTLTLEKMEEIFDEHWNICKGKHIECKLIGACENCGEFFKEPVTQDTKEK